MCSDVLYIFSLKHISHKKNSARYYRKCTSVFMYSIRYLVGFSKSIQTLNLIKIRPVVAELFHACGRTDKNDKANSRFSKFVNAP